jgi:hypothetical protein
MVAFIFLHLTRLAAPIALARPNHSDTPARLAQLGYHRGRSAKRGPLTWPYLPCCRLGHGPCRANPPSAAIQRCSLPPSLPYLFLPPSLSWARPEPEPAPPASPGQIGLRSELVVTSKLPLGLGQGNAPLISCFHGVSEELAWYQGFEA